MGVLSQGAGRTVVHSHGDPQGPSVFPGPNASRSNEHLDDDDDYDYDYDSASDVSFATTPALTHDDGTASLESRSVRSASPARSVYSLTSSLRERAFREVHGRSVNAHSDVYLLPADDEETTRLDAQHHMLKRLVPGILGPIDEVLADEPGKQKCVLDLGTGSAIWAIEVANDYPHVEVVGVDLAPMQSREFPPNCRVEVDDINLGMPHFYGQFDLVHARLISSGIKDYCGLIHEIARVLRPGGMVLIEEWDFRMYRSVNGQDGPTACYELAPPSTEEKPAWSALAEWLNLLGKAVRQRGGDLDAAAFVNAWVKQHGQFEDVGAQDVWIASQPHFTGEPLHRWARFRNECAVLMRADSKLFLRAGVPLLRSYTDDHAYVDELIRQAEGEMDDCVKHQYCRVQCTWARLKQPDN
ncbi:S-adenosyl-L-methionine-dependent methyltransferase [Dacryopinax primogenitus]|uniref:S-adenosyl-L-methionine-dependent methyltransferase n=1 Tax=Dacryopinax primogenitus (strain DJM 731) TaxID=1858805 RepID=M5FZM6_DACPD|nr:S-adenosyl-L-methionine-dependent methyltransferase [Dacryopinax primogenitus]EJT96957.1 S-adenosyl-L-methionine-dependent methyltransferase [Dacryopinax primogenitus]